MHEGISDMNPSVSLRVVTNAETAVLDQVFLSRPLQVPRDKMTPLKRVFSIVRGSFYLAPPMSETSIVFHIYFLPAGTVLHWLVSGLTKELQFITFLLLHVRGME